MASVAESPDTGTVSDVALAGMVKLLTEGAVISEVGALNVA